MLALLLRTVVFVEIVAIAFGWPALREHFQLAALPVAFLLFLAPVTLLLAGGYVISRIAASAPPAGLGGVTVAGIVTEWVYFVAVFAFIMPFARWWMGSDDVGRLAPARRPVLLVHGYMCNRAYWWWFRRKLRERGHAVATITLETPFSSIDHLAAELDRRIEALVAETGCDRVDIVSHSMGGLVTRTYMRMKGHRRIGRFVALAAPHHGTVLAHLGLGANARQMQVGSAWLEELNRAPLPPIPIVSIWSTGDEVVAPQDSSQLAGAKEIVLPAMGHVAFAFSETVVDLVDAELAG